MVIAYNVRSKKAGYQLAELLEEEGYETPLERSPKIIMNHWDVIGRQLVFIVDEENMIVTYQDVEYAQGEGYRIHVFKPNDEIITSNSI